MGANWSLLLGKRRQGVPSPCSQMANGRGGVSDSEELEVLGLGASSSTSVTLLSI